METTPKNRKRFFDFNHHEDAPQIPRVQDVLYALKLSLREEYYTASYQNNDTRYLANIGMVIEAVGNKTTMNGRSGLIDEAEQMIARMIVYLCPDEAACLLREAFINAKRLAGYEVPPKDASVDDRRRACHCTVCMETIRDQSTTD